MSWLAFAKTTYRT